jgi:CHAT domain-containing protein
VFGLQRAFHQAGVRHVVASLWRVDDRATAALMILFYKKLWGERLSTFSALRAAELELYRDPKLVRNLTEGRGLEFLDGPKGAPDHAHAWAAFVLSGVSRAELVDLVKEMAQRPDK